MTDQFETIPWEELEPAEKDSFTEMLHRLGIDVGIEEASEYYGNREKVMEELGQ